LGCVAVAFSERNFVRLIPALARAHCDGSLTAVGLLQTTSRPVVTHRELAGRAVGEVQLYQTVVCYRTLLQLLPAPPAWLVLLFLLDHCLISPLCCRWRTRADVELHDRRSEDLAMRRSITGQTLRNKKGPIGVHRVRLHKQ